MSTRTAISPQRTDAGGLFGKALTPNDEGAPEFLVAAHHFLLQHGRGPNLFTGCKDPIQVVDLRKQCATGNFNFEGHDPSAVADVLKFYLVELGEHILTTNLYDSFLKAASADPIQQLEVSRLVSKLPSGHQAALSYVSHLLHSLVNAPQNELSAESVATSIAPALLPARNEAHAAQWVRLTRIFIEKFEYLFATVFECAQISEAFTPSATPSTKKITMDVRNSAASSPNGSHLAQSTSPPSASGSPPPPPAQTATPPPTLNVEGSPEGSAPAILSPGSSGTSTRVPPPVPEKTTAAVLAARRLSQRVPAATTTSIGNSPLSRPGLSASMEEEEIVRNTTSSGDGTTSSASRAAGASSPTHIDNMVDTLSKLATATSLTAPVMLSSRNSFMVDTESALREHESHSARLRLTAAEEQAKLSASPFLPVEGFRIEAPSTTFTLEQQKPFTVIDQEKYFKHYQAFFAGKDHVNYVTPKEEGPDGVIGPAAISVVSDERSQMTKVLVRTTAGYELLALPMKIKKPADLAKALKATHPALQHANFRESKEKIGVESEVTKALLKYEQQNIQPNLKWGVLWRKQGQTHEDDMFANNNPSPALEDFLNLLGDRITLKGWTGYKGGLDVRENNTGTHSVHTRFCDFEIMFHVAPLLPFYPNDKQQLERKRHLGNDIVVIIFQDVEEQFSPTWLKSEFNHIFVLVTPVEDGKKYKVAISYKEAVPRCGPFLPSPPIFVKNDEFRQFFLTKLTNAERVALYAPAFADKLVRSRGILLQQIASSVVPKPAGTFRGLQANVTRTNLKDGMGGLLNRIGLSSSGDDTHDQKLKSSTGGEKAPDRAASPMLERKKSGNILGVVEPKKAREEALSPARDRGGEPTRNRSGSTTTPPAESVGSGSGRAASPMPATSPPTTSSPLSSSPGVVPAASPAPPSVTVGVVSPRVASPRPTYDPAWEDQVRMANEELAALNKTKFDTKIVISEVRVELSYLLEQRLDNNKLQDDAVATISLCANGKEMITKLAQEPKDVWFVQLVPDPSKIISVESGLYNSAVKEANAFLDFLTEFSNTVANESDAASASKTLRTLSLVADIFKKYRAKLQLTAEEKKLLELKGVIERSIRDTQYRIIQLQIMLRKHEADLTPATHVLRDINAQLKVPTETPVSAIEAVRKLHQLELEQVNIHTVAKAIDTAHFVRGLNGALAKVQENRPTPLYAELSEEDATIAMDRCSKSIDKLQAILTQPMLPQYAQDLSFVVRALKSFLRGTELLPSTPECPHKPASAAAIDTADVADLRDIASFGLKEVLSNLQSYALSTMSHEREVVSPDNLSFIQYCLHIEQFVKEFFALTTRPAPSLNTSSSGFFARAPGATPLKSSGPTHLTAHPPALSPNVLSPTPSSKPVLVRTMTQAMTAAATASSDDPNAVQRREQLSLAIARSIGEIKELLSNMEVQLLDATTVEEPTSLARVSMLLKKICNGQPTRVDELVRRPTALKPITPEIQAKIQQLKTSVMTTFLETKDFLTHTMQKLEQLPIADLNEAMALGRTVTSLRKIVRTYNGLD